MANGVSAWIYKSDPGKPTDEERLDRLQASIDNIGQQLERIARLISVHPQITTGLIGQQLAEEIAAERAARAHVGGGEP